METIYKNYNFENNLKKITQTYDYFNGNIINTDFLYFNYNNAYEKSSKRINNIISQINNKKNGIIIIIICYILFYIYYFIS